MSRYRYGQCHFWKRVFIKNIPYSVYIDIIVIAYINYLYVKSYKQGMSMEKVIRSNNDLGAAIRLARKASNLRQVDVARKASVRQALVSDIENGATTAKLDTVIRVLAALDLDLSVVPRRTTGFDPTEY